ncbi:MAG TPA: MlaD family protein, partial [Gemmatimonadota bacterium]|nr:MlaD family protein [Gemmatimonadota bacterium]
LGERTFSVVVVMPDAGGLGKGDRIHMVGVEVGAVSSVELEGPNRVTARLRLHRGLQLPRDSRAILQTVGVFGDVIVTLQPGESREFAVNGDTISLGTSSSLFDLAGDLGDQAEQVLQQVNQLLADSTIDQVHGAVAGLPGTVRSLERLAREGGSEFEALSVSLRETAETLRQAVGNANVEQLIADLEDTAAKLSETADSFKESAESLASIADKIDRGEGTLGLMVNDRGLYDDLRSAVQNVDALTQDLMQNPGRYIKISVF